MAGSQQRKEEWDCWILEASDMTGRPRRQWLLSSLRTEHREKGKGHNCPGQAEPPLQPAWEHMEPHLIKCSQF